MPLNNNKMMSKFCIIVHQAINLHAPLKTCLIKNDKPKIFLDRNKNS